MSNLSIRNSSFARASVVSVSSSTSLFSSLTLANLTMAGDFMVFRAPNVDITILNASVSDVQASGALASVQ